MYTLTISTLSLLLVAFTYTDAAASTVVSFVNVPASVKLSSKPDVMLHDVPLIAANLLGLTAEKPSTFDGEGDLLNRPEALAVFHTSSTLPSKHLFDVTASADGSVADVEESLKQYFVDHEIKNVQNDGLARVDGQPDFYMHDANEIMSPEAVKEKVAELIKAYGADNVLAIVVSEPTSKRSKRQVDKEAAAGDAEAASEKEAETDDEDKEAAQEDKAGVGAGPTPTPPSTYFHDEFEIEIEMPIDASNYPTSPSSPVKAHQKTSLHPGQLGTGPMNVYAFYTGGYPVAFHIILFIGIILGLSLLFIACGMWFMDPGKDSIIYRMTMSRAKKD